MDLRHCALILFSIFFLLTSCNRKHHEVTRGFYYWKTSYKPTAFELQTLRDLKVQRMYIRLFDVDADPATMTAIPIAPVRMGAKDTGFAYVPVVFITQKALATLNDTTLRQMARNICHLTEVICGQAGIIANELQIDCDWTAGTKDKYFALLQAIKEQKYMKGKSLSCTIRLHQVKYTSKSGVPPVDKGLLMCYSMGTLKKQGPYNSILDAHEAEDYLSHLESYPLAIDVALPLFEWCVLFRGKQFAGILHDIQTDAVKNSGLFEHKDGNLYACLKDSLWQGYDFKANDIVRLERSEYEDVLAVAEYSGLRISNTKLNVIFFDCDSITLKKFSNDELETIYNRYR